MTWTLGETVRESFLTGVAGESFTPTVARINGVTVAFDLGFTDLGGGFYEYSYTPDTTGSYAWMGSGSVTGALTINFEVEAAPVTTSPTFSGSGTTVATTTSVAANITIDASFQIIDNADAAVTGLTASDFDTLEAYLLPSGATTTIVSLTEIGNGEYAASFTPSANGTWTLHLIYHDGQLDRREFSADYEVEPRSSVTSSIVALGGVTTSFIQLVEDVARELGDCVELVATANGSNVTLKDDRRVQLASNAYAGREVYFASGTVANVGEWRFVTGSDPLAHTISFDPPLPANTTAADRALLFNERGRGFSTTEIKQAINRSIRFARTYALIDQMVTLADEFDKNTPEIALPDSFLYISSVEYEFDTDIWSEVRRASSPTDDGWFLLPGRGLRIQGCEASSANGYTVRLIGQGSPAELVADDDVTTVDAEWLVMQAASYLDRSGVDRSKNRDRERTMQYRQSLANELLPTIVFLPRPNATRVT